MLIEQLIDLGKIRTENLKIWAHLRDPVMDGWSVTQKRIFYKGRLLKKIFKSKIEARPVNAGHYMAFKHCISFATYLAANFGCNRFRITPDIVSKLLRAAI